MYYIADFEINEGNERIKDVARAGTLMVGVGGGALIGSEIGSAIRQNNLEGNINAGVLDEAENIKAQKELDLTKQGRLIQNSKDASGNIARRFEPKRLFVGNSKTKLLGAAVGGLGGFIVGTSVGQNFFPNKRFNDEYLREQRADRRKEAGRINRTSEEIRGWSNLARRAGKLGG
jgi:hypothetical protein